MPSTSSTTRNSNGVSACSMLGARVEDAVMVRSAMRALRKRAGTPDGRRACRRSSSGSAPGGGAVELAVAVAVAEIDQLAQQGPQHEDQPVLHERLQEQEQA